MTRSHDPCNQITMRVASAYHPSGCLLLSLLVACSPGAIEPSAAASESSTESGDGDGDDTTGDGDGDATTGDGDGDDTTGDGDGDDTTGDGDGDDATGDGDGDDTTGDGDGDATTGDGDGDEQPLPEPGPYVPQDGYDAWDDRWVIRSDNNQNLLAIDMLTGEKSELIQAWPWPEDHHTQIRSYALGPQALSAQAFVIHSWYDEVEDLGCSETVQVEIDTHTGDAQSLSLVEFDCCDDCGDGRYWSDPIIDTPNNLLHINYRSCSPNSCRHYVRTHEPQSFEQLSSNYIYGDWCDDEPCNMDGMLWDAPSYDIVEDPRHDDSVLVLLRGGILARLRTSDGGLTIEAEFGADWPNADWQTVHQHLQLDHASERVFVTTEQANSYFTLAIDLETKEQTPLYQAQWFEGGPIVCFDNIAFDSLRNRILYSSCSQLERVFALDVETAEMSELFSP